LVPHPDDAEIFLGATLIVHAERGDRVTLLMMTRGSAGSWMPWRRGAALAAARVREAEARVAALPGCTLRWLDLPDGGVRADAATIAQVRAAVEAVAPDVIYMPEHERRGSLYRHPDHLATGAAGLAAVRAASEALPIRFYHSRAPNRYERVDAVFAASQAALAFHGSQRGGAAFPPFLLHGIALLRARFARRWGRGAGCKYAEAFRSDPPD
jgi:LmbE family N-acetylglucosaminyl deacetylase